MFAPTLAKANDGRGGEQALQRSPLSARQANGHAAIPVLPRNISNQAMLRRLARSTGRPDACNMSAAHQAPGAIQPKLMIGHTDDPLEHEADRVADQMMRMPYAAASVTCAPSQIHRKCAACEEEEKHTLQLKSAQLKAAETGTPISAAPPIVHEVLQSHGQPLASEELAFFNSGFGF